jgi:prephenate dehydrogenase
VKNFGLRIKVNTEARLIDLCFQSAIRNSPGRLAMRFKQILIVGVGLIGGSFALAAKRANIAERITGWDHDANLEAALARGVIDDVEQSLRSGGVSAADLVYLAAPVGAIIDFLRTRADRLKPGALITDAGSTKREICRVARESLPRNVHFVGGHPMAGSHRTGVEFASDRLFCGAPYAVVCDDAVGGSGSVQPKPLREVIEVAEAIGARPVVLTAQEHDRAIARISHAPQLLSTALALACGKSGGENALALAGSGFFDMTRLAESRWSVWEDICRTNSDEITAALAEMSVQIGRVQSAISSGDFSSVREAFRDANDLMRQLNMRIEASTDSR